MEYCIQAWRPYRKKDIDKLDKIQQIATKMIPEFRDLKIIPELRDLSCESCLLECDLTPLEKRRLRGHQTEVFKIESGYEDIDRNITYKNKQLIVPPNKAMVRPHIDYCIQAWSPYRKKDIDKLEKNTTKSN